MTPEQALEHFQNLAQHGGVQFYPLDDSPGTRDFVSRIAEGGGHTIYTRLQGSATKLDPSKPLVLCTAVNTAQNINQDKKGYNGYIGASLSFFKNSLTHIAH